MRFIASENQNLDMNAFVKNAIKESYIDGLTIKIAPYGKNIMVIDSNTNRPIMPIEEFLSTYDFKQKEILLLVVGKERIHFDALNFALFLIQILERFPTQNISVYSSENALIDILKRFTNRISIGKYVTKDHNDYTDVDFYVFNPKSYRANLLHNLLKNHRNVMLSASSMKEEIEIMDLLNQSYQEGPLTKEEILSFSFLSPNPEIILKALYGNEN